MVRTYFSVAVEIGLMKESPVRVRNVEVPQIVSRSLSSKLVMEQLNTLSESRGMIRNNK